uniref:Large ribosomal subunit protein bL33c n=2 Tax=Gracilariopsis TaxID=2781 RepID=A0A1C9CET0_9FLOR|nr:ribosomal protein L33 [Gracilariopsis lemaneiformis]YP_009294633.1 ribosomal protein L33 [Gracilariopsis chorda]AJO68474.1 ribosomal protein L33 [Gracilariopsis lemaneiformis]AML79896.1 ribosomal protein L33 [Gracilariopsis lemaneiformis]AOM66893.1 ribosomal protein L33 [Gracilariopsis chorda]UAD88846.1 ribosomal protein L33 [Gracilariopsis chorda]
MSKNKGARIIITLECSCRNLNSVYKRKKGIFRYTSTKNRKNTPHRLELMKFCPHCNQHQQFKEIK